MIDNLFDGTLSYHDGTLLDLNPAVGSSTLFGVCIFGYYWYNVNQKLARNRMMTLFQHYNSQCYYIVINIAIKFLVFNLLLLLNVIVSRTS